MLRNIGAGDDPLAALSRVPDDLSRTPLKNAGANNDAASLPLWSHLQSMAVTAQTLRSSWEDLSVYWTGDQLADSISLYGLRAIAVNWEDMQVGWLKTRPDLSLNKALLFAREAQARADSIRATWQRMRTLGTDSAADLARKQMIGSLLDHATALAVAAVQQDSATSSFKPLIGFARDIVGASMLNNRTAAVHGVLGLASRVDSRLLAPSAPQLRLLTFTAEVAEAKDRDEVQDAFKRLVGQQSGYRGKRANVGRWYVKANAFVGGALGGELLFADRAVRDTIDEAGVSMSVSIPIGFEAGEGNLDGTSRGFFLQVVDLGAVASLRLFQRNVETFPEFSLRSIISPGIFWVRGFSNKPFASGIGAALAPSARDLRNGKTLGGVRVSAFFGVDVPIFP